MDTEQEQQLRRSTTHHRTLSRGGWAMSWQDNMNEQQARACEVLLRSLHFDYHRSCRQVGYHGDENSGFVVYCNHGKTRRQLRSLMDVVTHIRADDGTRSVRARASTRTGAAGVTQKELTAVCKSAGIDQRDLSAENLARAHAALCRWRGRAARDWRELLAAALESGDWSRLAL